VIQKRAGIAARPLSFVGVFPQPCKITVKATINEAQCGARVARHVLSKPARSNRRPDTQSDPHNVFQPRLRRASGHYLEVDYDLSNVMFITTANTLNIPPPKADIARFVRRRSGPPRSEDRLLKCWRELQICITQLTREGSPPPGLPPISGEVVTQFQSDSLRTDSSVRILHAQPGSPVSTA
jgi:hypothetical protein